MLAKRIIPTVLCRGRQLIKGKQFKSWRAVGNVAQAARIHAMRGVDELILLDIGATPEGRGPDLDLVRELAEVMYSPLTVGGGVRSVDDVNRLLRAGADKVAINTAAHKLSGYTFIKSCADRFGSQAIVVGVDTIISGDGKYWRCYTHCGTIDDDHGPRVTAERMENAGAGEILLTSIDREGMMGGYDLELIAEVTDAVGIPVIAHGGCGEYDHMVAAIAMGADAVAAGAMFQFTDQTPQGAAAYLSQHGIEVRINVTS